MVKSLNNTSDAFSTLRAFAQGWSGAERRGLSGLSPCRRYLLPAMAGSRDLWWPVRLVHGELSYVRQDLNGEFINDAARASRVLEKISPSRRATFLIQAPNYYSTNCTAAFSLNDSTMNRARNRNAVPREFYSAPHRIVMSVIFRISHRDERRGGQNGRRQCAIYNFYSAHMSAEIVARAWASAARRFTKFYEAPPTSAYLNSLLRWVNIL